MGYRTDFRAALVTALEGYAAANVGTLRGVYSARPGAIPELPAAWIDRIRATVVFFNGIRQHHLEATIRLALVVPDNAEAEDAVDVLSDGLLETLSDAHLVDGYSITTPTAYDELDIDDGGTRYLGLDYTVTLDLGQGRP